jgi:hypothetical protein
MQTNARKVVGLSSHLTQELEAFDPQSVYDAAMAMRYTKTGVTDTSKIEMVFGLNVYYALMSHRGHKSIGAGEDNHQTFEGARLVVDCKNLNRLAMRVSV